MFVYLFVCLFVFSSLPSSIENVRSVIGHCSYADTFNLVWFNLVWWFSFFSLNCCLTVNWYCYEKLENQSILRVQILSLIQSSAHLMIIPWFPVEPSWIFFLFRSEIWQVWRKWRRVWEWERKRRKRKRECQLSHSGATIKEKKGRPPRIKVWS